MVKLLVNFSYCAFYLLMRTFIISYYRVRIVQLFTHCLWTWPLWQPPHLFISPVINYSSAASAFVYLPGDKYSSPCRPVLFYQPISRIKTTLKTMHLPNNRRLPVIPSCAPVATEFKLPLAPARVLSIASRAYVKSLHALWPIRTPRPTCANQDAWDIVPPTRPKAT